MKKKVSRKVADGISYFQRLTNRVNFLQEQFPRKTIVFCAEDFRLIIVSNDLEKVKQAIENCARGRTPVIIGPDPTGYKRKTGDAIDTARVTLVFAKEPSPKNRRRCH